MLISMFEGCWRYSFWCVCSWTCAKNGSTVLFVRPEKMTLLSPHRLVTEISVVALERSMVQKLLFKYINKWLVSKNVSELSWTRNPSPQSYWDTCESDGDEGREGGREGGRERGREGERERGRERERERERGIQKSQVPFLRCTLLLGNVAVNSVLPARFATVRCVGSRLKSPASATTLTVVFASTLGMLHRDSKQRLMHESWSQHGYACWVDSLFLLSKLQIQQDLKFATASPTNTMQWLSFIDPKPAAARPCQFSQRTLQVVWLASLWEVSVEQGKAGETLISCLKCGH